MNVCFEYCETSRTWDPIVHGALSEDEAKHAFNAVVVTLREPNLLTDMSHKTKVIDIFNIRIIPAVLVSPEDN
jgi:hypothetical protein